MKIEDFDAASALNKCKNEIDLCEFLSKNFNMPLPPIKTMSWIMTSKDIEDAAIWINPKDARTHWLYFKYNSIVEPINRDISFYLSLVNSMRHVDPYIMLWINCESRTINRTISNLLKNNFTVSKSSNNIWNYLPRSKT